MNRCQIKYLSPPVVNKFSNFFLNSKGHISATIVANITYNQRSNMKMEADEVLWHGATISSVLYANINHAEWKSEFPCKL